MARTATAPVPAPESAALEEARDNIFREWLKTRTRQVFDEPAYTPSTKLYEDHQRWAAATYGADHVMSDAAFGERLCNWPKLKTKMLSVQTAVATGPSMKVCANLRLLPAIRAVG